MTLRRHLSVDLPFSKSKRDYRLSSAVHKVICITCFACPFKNQTDALQALLLLAFRIPFRERAVNADRVMFVEIGRIRPSSTLCLMASGSGSGQKIDGIDDRHCDDVFLGAEVECPHPIYDLCYEARSLHVRRLQLTQGH